MAERPGTRLAPTLTPSTSSGQRLPLEQGEGMDNPRVLSDYLAVFTFLSQRERLGEREARKLFKFDPHPRPPPAGTRSQRERAFEIVT